MRFNQWNLLFSQIADCAFWAELVPKSGENEADHDELPQLEGDETDVYSFGIMLLEVISGKLPCSEGHGSLLNWVILYWIIILLYHGQIDIFILSHVFYFYKTFILSGCGIPD